MEIGKYYKLEFGFFCFFPKRAALPATDSYKRNSERARVGGEDHGWAVLRATGAFLMPSSCHPWLLDISLGVCVFSVETSMDARLLHHET